MAASRACWRRRCRAALAALALPLAVLAASGCDLPRDARGTLERLRQGEPLRVGAASAPPFTSLHPDARPSGPEPELARRLAEQLGTSMRFREGAPHELVRALEQGALDLVIGGIPPNTYTGPGTSRAWIRTSRTVGVRDGRPPQQRSDLRGARLAARTDSVDAELGREAGAEVLERNEPFDTGLPVVAPSFELRAHDLTPAPFTLEETERVFLVRAGENAFLMELDRLLHREREWARDRLEEAARAPDEREAP